VFSLCAKPACRTETIAKERSSVFRKQPIDDGQPAKNDSF